MTWGSLTSGAAVTLGASFSDTITLGTLLVGVLIVIGFAWATRRDRRATRWEQLYNLADIERKEISAKLAEAMHTVAEQKEVIAKLEALKMPTRVMEVMNESVTRLNDEAASRQEAIRDSVLEAFKVHEEHAEDRTLRLLALLDLVAQRLGKE